MNGANSYLRQRGDGQLGEANGGNEAGLPGNRASMTERGALIARPQTEGGAQSGHEFMRRDHSAPHRDHQLSQHYRMRASGATLPAVPSVRVAMTERARNFEPGDRWLQEHGGQFEPVRQVSESMTYTAGVQPTDAPAINRDAFSLPAPYQLSLEVEFTALCEIVERHRRCEVDSGQVVIPSIPLLLPTLSAPESPTRSPTLPYQLEANDVLGLSTSSDTACVTLELGEATHAGPGAGSTASPVEADNVNSEVVAEPVQSEAQSPAASGESTSERRQTNDSAVEVDRPQIPHSGDSREGIPQPLPRALQGCARVDSGFDSRGPSEVITGIPQVLGSTVTIGQPDSEDASAQAAGTRSDSRPVVVPNEVFDGQQMVYFPHESQPVREDREYAVEFQYPGASPGVDSDPVRQSSHEVRPFLRNQGIEMRAPVSTLHQKATVRVTAFELSPRSRRPTRFQSCYFTHLPSHFAVDSDSH